MKMNKASVFFLAALLFTMILSVSITAYADTNEAPLKGDDKEVSTDLQEDQGEDEALPEDTQEQPDSFATENESRALSERAAASTAEFEALDKAIKKLKVVIDLDCFASADDKNAAQKVYDDGLAVYNNKASTSTQITAAKDLLTAQTYLRTYRYRLKGLQSGKNITTNIHDDLYLYGKVKLTSASDDLDDWLFERQSDGSYTIEHVRTGYSLIPMNKDSYSDLVTVIPNGSKEERWFITFNDDNSFLICNAYNGKYMDVNAASVADGAQLIQWPLHGGANQKFTLVKSKVGPAASTQELDDLHWAFRKLRTIIDFGYFVTGAERNDVEKIYFYSRNLYDHKKAPATLVNETRKSLEAQTYLRSGRYSLMGQQAGKNIIPALQDGGYYRGKVQLSSTTNVEDEWYIERIQNGNYMIKHVKSGYYLTPDPYSIDENCVLMVVPFQDHIQEWKIDNRSVYDLFTIINVKTNKSMDVYEGEVADGTLIYQRPVNDGLNQKFSLQRSKVDKEASLDDFKKLLVAADRLKIFVDLEILSSSEDKKNLQRAYNDAMDIYGNKTSSTAQIYLVMQQTETQSYLRTGKYYLFGKQSGHCLLPDGFSKGAQVKLAANTPANKKSDWYFERKSDGTYIIRHLNIDTQAYYLSVNPSSVDDQNLIVTSPTGTDVQKWEIVFDSGTSLMLRNVSTKKYMDVYGAYPGIGTQVIQWPLNNGANQKFEVLRSVDTTTAIPVTGVTLNENILSFYIKNATETLIATVAPTSAANKKVTWASNNTSVATVDTNGVVTAKADGTAKITVVTEDGNFEDTCDVSVSVALTGTSTISNTAPKIGDILTGSLVGGNNTGTLIYTWKAGGTQVGTNSATYTVGVGDLDKTITLEITSSVQTGTVTSAATAAVVKKAAPATPVAPTLVSKTHNSVTLTANTLYEFSKDGTVWQASNVFGSLTASTAYTFYQRIVTTADTLASAASPGFSVTTSAAPLTGTSTISNTAPKIGDILTGSLVGGNNTGTPTYVWKANGTQVGTNSATYTVGVGDLGKTITLEITSSVQTGTITSTATAAVVKKVAPAAPSAPTLVSKIHNSVTLTANTLYEFSKDGTTWQASNVFGSLTASTAYTFYQRIATTADTLASAASPGLSVTTSAASLTGTSTINNTAPKIGNTLTGSLVSGNNTGSLIYTWKAGGTQVGTNSATYTVGVVDLGKIITLEITSSIQTGIRTSAATTAVVKKAAPATPVAPTLVSKTHNSVTLTANTLYEFSKDGTTWQTSNVFSGLTASTAYMFYQRVATTADTLASAASSGFSVTTNALPAALTGTSTISNTAPRIGNILTGSLVGGNNTGTLIYIWKAGGTQVGTNSATYTVGVGDLGKIITLEITSSIQTGLRTSAATTAVVKKPAPAAPSAPTLVSKTHNSVTLTANTLYEFSKDGTTWQTSNVFGSLTASTTYMFYQRVATTADTLASAASSGFSVTTNGETTFPESAHPYANNFDYTWTHTVPDAGAVNITFSADTKVETTYDKIYIMDDSGNNISGSPFTGTQLAGATKTVNSGTVKIRLTTDSLIADYGFKVTNIAMSAPVSVFPESAHPYVNNFDYTWIHTVSGAGAVNITFSSDTKIENNHDKIYIMDGNGNNISGSPFTGIQLAGATKTVNSGTVKIRLTTDDTVTDYGFKVTNIVASTSTIALTGTSTISNTAPKIGDILTGSLVSGNNTGTLTYTWKAGGTQIGIGLTYTVQVGDLGKTITLELTSSIQTGTRTSTATAAVTKKPAPAAPVAPTLVSKTNNSVTLTAKALYEFSKDGTTWQTSNVFSGLTSNTAYTFYQRIATTADTLASAASSGFSVTTNAQTYTITVNTNNTSYGTATANLSSAVSGTTITLTATPNSGYRFVNWTGTGVAFASSANASTTFTMPISNVTITANFELIPVTGFPESAHPYANNFDYTWTHTVPDAGAVNITFSADTKVETTYDKIYIMDDSGNNISGSPFTGTQLAGATKTVNSGTVKIRLTTDSLIADYGFKVTNIAMSAPVSVFPESAHPYADKFDYTWTHTVPGAGAVNITFSSDTKLENNHDKIYIMDGNGNNISGSPFTGTQLSGATKIVNSGTVKIRLTTDASVTDYGFKVTNIAASAPA